MESRYFGVETFPCVGMKEMVPVVLVFCIFKRIIFTQPLAGPFSVAVL